MSPEAGHAAPLLALDAVAFDTETTGLDARVAHVVQIGALRLRKGAIVEAEQFERLVNPGRPIPPIATGVHGITDAIVAGAPPFKDVAESLEAFIGRSILIGYAIYYDLAVLEREYSLAKRNWPGFRALDVRMLARLAAPALADHSLERLCEWLGVEIKGRHTAMGDAEAAGRVFLALLPLLREKDIRTLAEAQAASRVLAENEARASGAFLPAVPEPDKDTRGLERIDSFPYRYRVREVMSSPPLFAAPETTVRDALRLLIEKRVSSVFVRAATGETGIVTERDILRAIDDGGADAFSTRIDAIMKAPLQTVAENAFLYRAIGRIERLGFRHLGVRDEWGTIVGAVTTRNLLRHRATTAIILGDEIESAASDAELGAAWSKLTLMARKLMQEAADPLNISAVVSAEICSMTRRAADLAGQRMREEGMGPPPVPFAVMVLGSAGRGESQLAADQDNAIVYAQGQEGGPEDLYFENLAGKMNLILDAAGIPLCKGGVMARNTAWRKSADAWRTIIEGWVRGWRPQDLLNVDIFFDALPVHGTASLADSIWDYAYGCGHAARPFQDALIERIRKGTSAFTLFGNFRLNARSRVDLKWHGLLPIFSAARVLSIRHGVRARSTRERLEGVAAKGIGSPALIQSIVAAHRTILGAIISQQIADAEAGIPASTHVAPERLDKAAKAELKVALLTAEDAVGLATEGRL
jgi:DNA polymerase-3 subunit epsilon/CBS domain-containing protein